MKLQCQVDVVNRTHIGLNIRPGGKYLRSTLAIGKEVKPVDEYFILHFSTSNKMGTKYKVSLMKQVFAKYLNEGKATIRFEEPPHDLCIKCEPIQLKCFMKLLQQCVTGKAKNLPISSLANISVTSKDHAPTKLVIKDRSEFPSKGLPRTLESLILAGLKLCNFRRDILLLKNLTVLDLSNNEIEKLPPEFGRMPNLLELHLANNKLGEMTKVDWRWLVGPQIAKSLKLLDLCGNQLVMLPKSIWNLQKLVTLKVDNNRLSQLPSTLGRMTQLRYLTVSKNELNRLPCSLLNCRLDHLDVSGNNFDQISVNMEKFKGNRSKLFFVKSLVKIAGAAVLKNKIYYAPNIIPRTLVETLDNFSMCVCGNPVLDSDNLGSIDLELRNHFRSVVCDTHSSRVEFESYICSFGCFSKFRPLKLITFNFN